MADLEPLGASQNLGSAKARLLEHTIRTSMQRPLFLAHKDTFRETYLPSSETVIALQLTPNYFMNLPLLADTYDSIL
jgi:hypothetical protein